MTIASVRTYRLLVWILPLLLVILARDPLLNEILAVIERVRSILVTKANIRNTGVTLAELPKMKDDYERLAHKKIAIASSLLGAGSEASLYDLLMLKADETGVSIVSVAPRARRTDGAHAVVPLTLDVSGTFNAIVRFTAAVENVNRLMRVEELLMTKDRGGRLVASLQLLVYSAADTAYQKDVEKKRKTPPINKQERYRAELEKALAVEIPPSSHTLDFSVESDPFGVVAAAPVKKSDKPAAPSQPPGLVLKGILWKDPPLAIIEALDGQTYIVRQGDPVNGFKIASIGKSEVVIAAPQGNYVLHQYEK